MVRPCRSVLWMLFLLAGTYSIRADELAVRGNMTQSAAADLVSRQRLLVIAHRGDSQRAPENTLPAFRSAVQAGADLVELDYHHSADNVPVVIHDKDLDRTTDAVAVVGTKKTLVASQTFAQLQGLDAGTWFDASFAGTRIPSLDESLDLIQAGSVTLVEHKQGDPLTCIELLQRKELLEQVVVQSFDWHYLGDCHRLAPRLVLAALGDRELTSERLDQIQQTGARIVAWNHKHLGPVEIEAIHTRGLKAWTYTVNDPVRAAELIALGLDGIITDVPAVMLKLLQEPAESP